jgi:hypothetical protein
MMKAADYVHINDFCEQWFLRARHGDIDDVQRFLPYDRRGFRNSR